MWGSLQEDGVLLVIHAINNPEEFGILEWLTESDKPEEYLIIGQVFEPVEHPNINNVYKSSHPIFEIEAIDTMDHAHSANAPEDPSKAVIKNSLKIEYIMPSEKKIYLASCAMVGNEYKNLLEECEKIIKTFKIIEQNE